MRFLWLSLNCIIANDDDDVDVDDDDNDVATAIDGHKNWLGVSLIRFDCSKDLTIIKWNMLIKLFLSSSHLLTGESTRLLPNANTICK